MLDRILAKGIAMRSYTQVSVGITLQLMAAVSFSQPSMTNPLPSAVTPTFAQPIPGQPISANVVVEHAGPSQGSAITQRKGGRIFRDSNGRTRQEIVGTIAQSGQSVGLVRIVDAGGGFEAQLIPAMKAAFRNSFSPPPSGMKPKWTWIAGSELLYEQGKRSTTTEPLGTMEIDGAVFEGQLTTVTVEGQSTLTARDELWYSESLGIIGLIVASGPNGKITYRIESISRAEPDATLFVVPPDYTIKDISLPLPPR